MIRTCTAFVFAIAATFAADTMLVEGGVETFAPMWAGGLEKSLVDGPNNAGKALRLEVKTQPEQPWMAQIWLVPLKANIAEGDTLRVTLRARCIAPADGTGKIQVAVGQNAPPYNHLLTETIVAGAEWKEFTISGVATEATTADKGRFGFVVGQQVQTVEIANIAVSDIGKK